jgi:hypothetical protein
MLCLFLTIITFFSCSKDSDLLTDYVALDPDIGAIAKFVANDTYQVSISSNPEDDTFEITINSGENTGSTGSSSTGNTLSGGTVDDSFQTSSSASIILDVLANDTFNNLDNVSIAEISQPDNGEVVINSDKTLTYTPFTVEASEDTFTYTAEFIREDGTVGKETGTVTVIINPSTVGQDKGQGSIIFNTDFETVQWTTDGSTPNTWEYDQGIPRTTDHGSAAISKGRDGTGRAVWLGDYNGHSTRNELGRGRLSNWGEHWIGYSIMITEAAQSSRVYSQFRNMVPKGLGTGRGVVNPVTLRQGAPGKLYFATATIAANVDVVQPSGASTGTQSLPAGGFDYKLNEWIDIVIHWKLAFGSGYTGPATPYDVDGYLEIWVNGEKIIDHIGTTTYRYANETGVEYDGDIAHTIGVYWSSTNSPQGNVYFDEYKVWEGSGGTYEDVSPLGLSPNN